MQKPSRVWPAELLLEFFGGAFCDNCNDFSKSCWRCVYVNRRLLVVGSWLDKGLRLLLSSKAAVEHVSIPKTVEALEDMTLKKPWLLTSAQTAKVAIENGNPESVRFNEVLAIFQRMPRLHTVDARLGHDSKWYKSVFMFANKFKPMPSVTQLTLGFTNFTEVVTLLNLLPELQTAHLAASQCEVPASTAIPKDLQCLRKLTVTGPKKLELSLLDFLTDKTLEKMETLKVDRLSWITSSPRAALGLSVGLTQLTIEPVDFYAEGELAAHPLSLADLTVFRHLTKLRLEVSMTTSHCTIEDVVVHLPRSVTELELGILVGNDSVLTCSKSVIGKASFRQIEVILYVPRQLTAAAQQQSRAQFSDMLGELGKTFFNAGIVMTHTIELMA